MRVRAILLAAMLVLGWAKPLLVGQLWDVFS
jgi:hypothetical protein